MNNFVFLNLLEAEVSKHEIQWLWIIDPLTCWMPQLCKLVECGHFEWDAIKVQCNSISVLKQRRANSKERDVQIGTSRNYCVYYDDNLKNLSTGTRTPETWTRCDKNKVEHMETHTTAAKNTKTRPWSVLEMTYANTPIKGRYSSQTAAKCTFWVDKQTETVQGMSQGTGHIINQHKNITKLNQYPF